ncbi:odorant receptor 49a-like [Haematobia irritans]|uniref:odorant receptor 49a-like n=1 Tax=Haematobia irritans TaxID=7368 RepID=UPI003F506C88
MAEVERYFEDFIKLPNFLLTTLGIDFVQRPRMCLLGFLMKIYFVLTLMCCVYCTYFVADETLDEILEGAHNLPLLLRLFNDLNYNAIGILKSYYFIRHLKEQRNLYGKFEKIFPKSLEDRFAYRVNENFWPKWITTILYMYFCATAVILFSPLVESLIEYAVALIKMGYTEAPFTYHKLYEEQSYVIDHHSPLAYILIYSMEVMNSHYAIVFNICPDIWLVGYAIQLCMHFDYISRNLENYEPKEEKSNEDSSIIAGLVKKHQILLEMAEDLKEIFSLLVLVMLFSTVATLFCAAVYLLTQGLSKDVIGYMAFLPTSLGQYFMVCYYGQQIINKSLEIGEAAYSQTWYNGCQSYKKSILAILGRSQRQCEINAGGFQTTNLKGFESVMRMTFQLFTLWRTMMEPN